MVCDSDLLFNSHCVSWVCQNKSPQTRWLKTTGICSLIVVEAASSKSRCQQGWFFLEALREILFHVFLLISGGVAILGIP